MNFRIFAQPCAIVRGDKSAKTRQAPIVGALPQHQPRMADRPAHDRIYEAVHRSARCLSVGDIPESGAAKAAPLTSRGERPDLAQDP